MTLPPLSENDKNEVSAFKRWMQQKRLSSNTVNTYADTVSYYLRYVALRKLDVFTVKSVDRFNYEFIVVQGKSVSYQNQCINSIKKYWVFKGGAFKDQILSRPKKPKKLPQVLTQEEVKALLEATTNLKHKTLLAVTYSAGLRIGEALTLRINDIDSKRMLIFVKSAKGKKDRYTLLSRKLILLLRTYFKHYRPKTYLFEGQNGQRYSNTSARSILQKALKKAAIKKTGITLHTLRHSFATHVLENGTNIRYIQELLGHNDLKTTMLYTHVTEKSIKNIKNPFDDIQSLSIFRKNMNKQKHKNIRIATQNEGIRT